MARPLRIEFQNAFHHVFSRGYNRMNLFYDQEDFTKFIEQINQVFLSHRLKIHAYCLMSNHFHLFTETPLANLQQSMHKLLSLYSSYFKRKYEFTGKVFEKRYKSILVDSNEYAFVLTRYIHLNPKGVLVKDAESWLYSSYRQYLGFDRKELFLNTETILSKFHNDKKKAINLFWKFHKEEESEVWELSDYLLEKNILGSENFLDSVYKHLPEEINTEISNLIGLKSREIARRITNFLSINSFGQTMWIDLMIYFLRMKTSLRTSEINVLIGKDYKASTLSNRLKKFKKRLEKDQNLGEKVKELNLLLG